MFNCSLSEEAAAAVLIDQSDAYSHVIDSPEDQQGLDTTLHMVSYLYHFLINVLFFPMPHWPATTSGEVGQAPMHCSGGET